MSRFLSRRVATAAFSLFVVIPALGAGEVEVQLVPSHSPPFYTGEQLTIDVLLQSNIASQAHFRIVQFDFSDSSQGVELESQFHFDYPGVNSPNHYNEAPLLLVPKTSFLQDIGCSPTCGCYVCLSSGASIQVGSIGARMPDAPGTYTI